MIWAVAKKIDRRFVSVVVGLLAVPLVVFWVFKIRHIQRLRSEIVQVEIRLSKGQELWKNSPPLSPRQKEELQKVQERLVRMLPKERDVPPVLEDVSRVARDYNLADFALSTGGGPATPAAAPQPASVAVTPQAPVPQTVPAASPGVAGGPGPIDSFPIRVTFAGDYREIAYFVEALQKVPRLMTIQSLLLQRALPLVTGEVVLNAYYLRGDLSVKTK